MEDDSGNSLGYLPNTTPTLWSGKLGSGLVPKSSAACFYTVASSGTEGAYLIRYVQTGLPGYFCIYGWGTPEYVYKLTQPSKFYSPRCFNMPSMFHIFIVNSWGNYECPVWNLMGDDFSANWQWSPQYSREPLTFFLVNTSIPPLAAVLMMYPMRCRILRMAGTSRRLTLGIR